MKNRFRNTFVEIDLQAIQSNYHVLKNIVGDSHFFCPMIKANAYGHGALAVCKALESVGADKFGLALIEEGIALRESGIKKSELFIFGNFDQLGAQAIQEYNLTPVLSNWEQIKHLENLSAPINFHLKFNTGMNRLGFSVNEVDALVDYVESSKLLNLTGVCTHLAEAEDLYQEQGHSVDQLNLFNSQVKTKFKQSIDFHALNSSGIYASKVLKNTEILKNLGARPGISLYGISSDLEQNKNSSAKLSLKSALQWKTEVVHYQKVRQGEGVSYGFNWEATQDSVIAILGVGYADGYKRCLSNRSQVLFRGEKAPVVGTVCMDYSLVDVTDMASKALPSIGEEVILLGTQGVHTIGAENLAQWSNSITYEIFTSISERVPRVYSSSL